MIYIINMLKKDWILLKSKKHMLLFLIFPLTMGLALSQASSIEKVASSTVMGITFTSYILVTYIFGLEERNKFEVVFNSFPISRNLVVFYKYVFIVAVYFAGVILTCLIPSITILVADKGFINFKLLRMTFIGYTSFFAIYLPIYFKYGYMKMSRINLILYLLIITFPAIIPKLARIELLKIIFNNYYPLIQTAFSNYGLIIYILLLVVSLVLSLNIYSKKEV